MDCCQIISVPKKKLYKRIFLTVLAINFVMFFVEATAGIFSGSSGLLADSLDMLSDAFIYSVSLLVLSAPLATRKKAVRIQGVIMFSLGFFVFLQSLSKMYFPIMVQGEIMSLIGLLAFVANLVCFLLLTRYKDEEVSMKSSWICSRNDILGNISVILGGFLVVWTGSNYPDIFLGVGISILIMYFSLQIFKEKQTSKDACTS
jgi:Co/Zn/Cd efflux system component